MKYDGQPVLNVMQQMRLLPFWKDFESQVAVAIVGSVGAGMGDLHSDLDVYIFVPEKVSLSLYRSYQKAYEAGTIDVLNPRAFDYDEFPMVRLTGVEGHHRAMVFESIEENVRSYNDVDRWVCLNCMPLHDPLGRLESLRAESAEYPPNILNLKLIRHYWFMRDHFFSTKKPLERGQKETVTLLCLQGISHLMKFCILCEGKPYPYDKWLYRVASDTKLGKLVRESLEALFEEIHRKEIIFEKPVEYARPGHNNEPYENYRIYHILTQMMVVLDTAMPDLKMDKTALLDRIGAWKPR